VFNGAKKNATAPQVFLVLCAYIVITTVYTLLLYNNPDIPLAWLIRMGLGIAITASYVIVERSKLNKAATAFLSPTIIAGLMIFGAVFFGGDSLLFMYICGIAQISLTYFNKKGLAAHLIVVNSAFAVILFGFNVDLLGVADFNNVFNYIFFIASAGLNILTYMFCLYCIKTLKALTEAKSEADLAAQAKGRFLAKMSHEIRTPLNAVIGLTETELRKGAEGRETFQKIHASGNLLLGIINDILDMSKIESGKYELVPAEYDFAEMIYDTVALNKAHIGGKPVKFLVSVEANIPSRLFGDNLRIKQLLGNLLSNAFKYTNEGSVTLRASWRAEREDEGKLVFEIADTGIGIKKEDIKDLFAEYSQVDKNNHRYTEGTGLGLSICCGLAELMKGKISVRSEYGQGSVFTAEITQKAVDSTPVGETAAELNDFRYVPAYELHEIDYASMTHANVLVVDDIEINLEVISCCLEPYGINVECVTSGTTAVERVKNGMSKYDLILMDHMMPGMDGIETLRAIRALGTEYALSVPIVALTANALAGVDKMFGENGFQGFLAKPVEAQKLDAVLRQWLN